MAIITYYKRAEDISLEYHGCFGEVKFNGKSFWLDDFLEEKEKIEGLDRMFIDSFIDDLKKLGEIL